MPRQNAVTLAICAWLALSGCALAPAEPGERSASAPIEGVLQGKGAPPVIFESGLGQGRESWSEVAPAIEQETSVWTYDRPGYGRRPPATTPRDGDRVVEELRATLRANGVEPPYVLVGHSLGGLYMQLFARRHPQEVAGLVLVDSTHPRQFEGAGSAERRPLWMRALLGVGLTGVARTEFDAIDETGREVLAAPVITGKPVVILVARDAQNGDELSRDIAEKRADLGRLYPGSD